MTAQPSHRRYTVLCAVATFLLLLVSLVNIPLATAAQSADSVIADVVINEDGSLNVTETLAFSQPLTGEITQKLATTKLTSKDSDHRYHYTVSNISVHGGQMSTKTQDDAEVITITASNATKITVSYTVMGTTYTNADGTVTAQWSPIQGFSFPIEDARVQARIPERFMELECHAGSVAAPRVCKAMIGGQAGHDLPEFRDGPLGSGEILDIRVRFPQKLVADTAKVSQDWSLDRAFHTSGWPLGSALMTALAGGFGLWWLARRAGHDAGFHTPTRIADFAPVGLDSSEFVVVEPIRPGQAGTLSDELVNPIDITATVVDLAQRGHLLITELPREGAHGALDWTLTRQDCDEELAPYELALLDLIAPAPDEPLRVSALAGTLQSGIGQIQDKLYDAMVEQGWYVRRPDDTRNRARAWGIGLLVASLVALIALVTWTRFGLLGLTLVALSVGLLAIKRELPARTAQGASVLAGLHMLATQLQTEPTDRMPKGCEYAELSEVLPYAIVLGGRDRWVQAIADADDDSDPDPQDLAWYHAPQTWNLADFPASIDAFITTVTGKLFDRG
ncbi:MAG: DUF2207 domain-containing protein [Propionibacteriaceae bacterium]